MTVGAGTAPRVAEAEPYRHPRRKDVTAPKRRPTRAGRPAAAKTARDSGSSRQGRGEARRLVEVHNHYRRELTQVREILRQVRKGSASTDRARGRINTLALATADGGFSEICRASCRSLAEHHRLEDRTVFPHLRRSERSLQPALDRLDKEHRTIHTLLKDVDRALVHLARNPGDHAPVTQAINLLTDAVLSHFAYEEREATSAPSPAMDSPPVPASSPDPTPRPGIPPGVSRLYRSTAFIGLIRSFVGLGRVAVRVVCGGGAGADAEGEAVQIDVEFVGEPAAAVPGGVGGELGCERDGLRPGVAVLLAYPSGRSPRWSRGRDGAWRPRW